MLAQIRNTFTTLTLGCLALTTIAGCPQELVDESAGLIGAVTNQVNAFNAADDPDGLAQRDPMDDPLRDVGSPDDFGTTTPPSADAPQTAGLALPLDQLAAIDPHAVGFLFDPHFADFSGFDASGLYADDDLYADLWHSYYDVYGVEPDSNTLENWYASYVYYAALAYAQSPSAWNMGDGQYYEPATNTSWYDYGTWSYGYNDGYNAGYSNTLLNTSVSSSGDSGYVYIDGDFVSW